MNSEFFKRLLLLVDHGIQMPPVTQCSLHPRDLHAVNSDLTISRSCLVRMTPRFRGSASREPGNKTVEDQVTILAKWVKDIVWEMGCLPRSGEVADGWTRLMF